jgi:adenylate kinase
MATYIVLLGPPGVGKGTQAKIISGKAGLPHVSSGDLFRDNITKETDLGKQAQAYMQKGELVPDDLTIAMVRDRLAKPDCGPGAILDGFPRTPEQAEALRALLAAKAEDVSVVPFLNAAVDVLVERLSGRLTCRAHGHVYHRTLNPPKVEGVCDIDGSELYQREDDRADTVRRRIRVYLEQTAPLVEHYRTAGKLREVDGALAVDQVTAALEAVIGSDA